MAVAPHKRRGGTDGTARSREPPMRIEHDQSRFKQIVRGKIRQNLRKYVTHGEMIGRKGRDLVSIPIPQLDVPHFRYGKNGSGGVGQGDGEDGHADRHRRAMRKAAPEPPAAIRAATCSKSKSRSRNWPRSWATSWNCPASSPRARPTSSRRKSATPASAAAAPSRCGTSSAPTWKPCGGRFPRTPTCPIGRASCPFATTSATAPGTK